MTRCARRRSRNCAKGCVGWAAAPGPGAALTDRAGVVAEVEQGEPEGVVGVAQLGVRSAGRERRGAAVEHRLPGDAFQPRVTARSVNEPGGAQSQPGARGTVLRLATQLLPARVHSR